MVRKATLLAVCGLLACGVAWANVPDPDNSECHNVGAETAMPVGLGLPPCGAPGNFSIYVVGNSGAVADPIGEFCVTVRNFNNIPINGSSVIIDFSDCDLQLCKDQLDPDVEVDCVSQTVRKNTNASGVACFRVRGKTRNDGIIGPGCGGAIKDCAKIFAGGTLLCSADAPTFDLVSQNGNDGVDGNDLSVFNELQLVCGTSPTRANYDCTNHVVDGNDLSIFQDIQLVRTGSIDNCAGLKNPEVGPKCP